MKNLMTLAYLMITAVLLNGCGALNDSCGSDIRMGCNAIFGELPDDAVANELQEFKQDFVFFKEDTNTSLSTFSVSLDNLKKLR